MVKLKVFSDVTKHKVTESFLALHTVLGCLICFKVSEYQLVCLFCKADMHTDIVYVLFHALFCPLRQTELWPWIKLSGLHIFSTPRAIQTF